MMRRMGKESRKYRLYISLCWKAKNVRPENTLFKVCKLVTESVTFADKLTYFFSMDCQNNQGGEEHTLEHL